MCDYSGTTQTHTHSRCQYAQEEDSNSHFLDVESSGQSLRIIMYHGTVLY